MKYVLLYILVLIVFLGVDLLWLTVISKNLYKTEIGHLMAENPKLLPALIFYMVYVAGVIVISVLPGITEKQLLRTVLLSALLGFIAYGTYDLTNFATLKDWPAKIVFIDLAWGTVVTTLTGTAGFFIARLLKIA